MYGLVLLLAATAVEKPTLTLYTMPGCPACVRLETTLLDPGVREELKKWDFRRAGVTRGVSAYPTLAAGDSRHVGYMTPAEMLTWLQGAQPRTGGTFRWVRDENSPGYFYLYLDSLQLGTFHPNANGYRRITADGWSPAPEEPPIPLPAEAANYGVDWQPAESDTAEALEGIPDDGDLLRVTIIGPDAERKAVLADFERAPLAEYRGKVVLADYAPDHRHVSIGFITTGKPTIYITDPAGKVLHRQDDYVGGAKRLATALRRADPNYDPANDPDLTKPPVAPPAPPAPIADGHSHPATPVCCLSSLLFVLAAAGGLAVKKGKKK